MPLSRMPREKRAPPTQFLILSLFLLLLAFFIALTAGAEFDDNKTYPVLDSLGEAFPVNRLRGQGVPSVIEQADFGTNIGHAIDQIEGLFRSDLFPFAAQVTREKGAVIVSMPVSDMEELLGLLPMRVTTPIQRQSFIASLAGLVQSHESRPDFLMSIIVHTNRPPSLMAAGNRTALTRRILQVESYVTAFEEYGLISGRMMTGIQRGDVDKVSLIFSPLSSGGAE